MMNFKQIQTFRILCGTLATLLKLLKVAGPQNLTDIA